MIGGYMGSTFGIRYAFFVVSALLGIAFLSSLLFIKEDFTPKVKGPVPSFKDLHNLSPIGKVLSSYLSLLSFLPSLLWHQPYPSVFVQHIVGRGHEHIALLAGLASPLQELLKC